MGQMRALESMFVEGWVMRPFGSGVLTMLLMRLTSVCSRVDRNGDAIRSLFRKSSVYCCTYSQHHECRVTPLGTASSVSQLYGKDESGPFLHLEKKVSHRSVIVSGMRQRSLAQSSTLQSWGGEGENT